MEKHMKIKKIFPPNSQRVIQRTDPKINTDIRNQTLRSLNIFKKCDEPELTERIQTLAAEWDTERVLEVNAAALILLSSYLGIRTSRIWFLLTGTTAVFMLQHALKGWCPIMPFIRKWGVRTMEEIYTEKTALKIMRGDFNGECQNGEDALTKAEKQ